LSGARAVASLATKVLRSAKLAYSKHLQRRIGNMDAKNKCKFQLGEIGCEKFRICGYTEKTTQANCKEYKPSGFCQIGKQNTSQDEAVSSR
jgi:hypothetical protein